MVANMYLFLAGMSTTTYRLFTDDWFTGGLVVHVKLRS